MKKHISYIVLALLLAIFLAPATVMAQGEGTGGTGTGTDPSGESEKVTIEVTAIDLSVKPILGSIVNGSEYAYATTPVDAKNTTVTPIEARDELVIHAAYWYKISNEQYTGNVENDKSNLTYIDDESEVFQDGYHYYVEVILTDYINSDDQNVLRFSENISGTINNHEASVSHDTPYVGDNFLSIAGYVDVKGIYDIDMTITAPSVGAKADYDKPKFTVTDDVCEESSELGVTIVDEEFTTWYKIKEDDYKDFEESVRELAWEPMEEDEEYTTGYYYMVWYHIRVSNNENYDWLWRTISKNLTGTLNGEKFDEIHVQEGQYDADLYKCFSPLSEPAPAPTPVDDYTPPETGVYGPEEFTQSNNFIWLTLLFVGGGAVAVTTLVNKKKKYNR